MGVSWGFSRLSCGYVGSSDGYTDLVQHHKMEFEFDEARNGNVALTGELNLSGTRQFTVGIAFGETLPNVVSTLFQSLGVPYKERRQVFISQWQAAPNGKKAARKSQRRQRASLRRELQPLTDPRGQALSGRLRRIAHHSLGRRAKRPGRKRRLPLRLDARHGAKALWVCWRPAIRPHRCAPLSIWLPGRTKMAGFLKTSGSTATPSEMACNSTKSHFPCCWPGVCTNFDLLGEFDPLVMVKRAGGFLLHRGPVTGEERWEEASGYSPSTLAAVISALICAAGFSRAEKEEQRRIFPRKLCGFPPRPS